MRRLVLIALAVACLGSDWPQKGDTVYVPGELAGAFLSAPLTLGHSTIAVPACAPLEVAFKPKPARLYVQDAARGAAFKLCEGWSAWVAKTRDACTGSTQITLQKKDGCYAPAH